MSSNCNKVIKLLLLIVGVQVIADILLLMLVIQN